MQKNILVVYYTYTSHTKIIAKKIQKELGCDILELKPHKPYSTNYEIVVEDAKQEIAKKYEPKLENINIDLNKYDTIVLGTPVWWYTMAPVIRTFLKNNDLKGKTIIPFATNAGWLGTTFEDIKQICIDSQVKDDLDIVFWEDYKSNEIVTPIEKIEKWIQNIKK